MTKPLIRSRPAPIDLVRVVRDQLNQTGDEQRRGFLISLASDLLRRRQTTPKGVKPARRWR